MPFPIQATIDALKLLLPTADSAANTNVADVVGNKSDTITGTSLIALVKVLDAAVDAIQADIGNYSGQTNLQSLLAALGIPDTAGKPLYTCVVTDRLDSSTYGLSALKNLIDTIDGIVDNLYVTNPRIVNRNTATIPDSTQTPYFTVSGRVLITQIVGEVTDVVDATVTSIKLISNPTVGADVDLCAATAITDDAVGTLYSITGTLSDALIATTSGAFAAQAQAVCVTAGTIDLHSTATQTGKTKWTLHYIPLDSGSTIVVA